MNENNLNLIAAVILSVGIIVGWQYFYERPNALNKLNAQKEYKAQMREAATLMSEEDRAAPLSRLNAIMQAPRVAIVSDAIRGSISLKGVRFDDVTLVQYKDTIDVNSPNVNLLSPALSKEAYFAEVGWRSKTQGVTAPDSNTIFTADKPVLKPGSDVTFTWKSPENVIFSVNVSLDNDYMFTIKQLILNSSSKPIAVEPYGLVNRNYDDNEKAMQILHQGAIATIDGKLRELTYEDLKDKKSQRVTGAAVDWIGITDKYWLTAFIPDESMHYNAGFSYSVHRNTDKFQVDFLGAPEIIDNGEKFQVTTRLFVGAKKVGLLDKYESDYQIKLFDRAIDFGIFYVITKPVFNALNFFYRYCGNFGVSILIVTVLVKLAMFTISTRSYNAMAKMKAVQPEIERIKSLYSDNKAQLNQEIMELYKREKINPVSGCLPMLIQIPVFFSLYKVLYVTIEMRQAPFFWWIHDLSAPDPTNIINLFGLLPFNPPSFLPLGVLPILMAATMYLQQRMSPEPADQMQAQVMRFMPLLFLFMFGNFPAGLLIYWTWSNILSILQQVYVNRITSSNTKKNMSA